MTAIAGRRRRSPLATLGLVLALVLAACTGPGEPDRAAPTVPTAAPPTTSPAPVARGTLKPVGAGLYYTANAEPQAGFQTIDHSVVGGPWADFEPRPGSFSGPGWDRVEAALRDRPDHKFRLRIMAGRGSPDWAKRLGGSCIQIEAPSSQIPSCVPRFWTDTFLDAYRRLMTEVARRYDREPRILDVVNSACTTTWAEPFIKTGYNRSANLALWEAGLNQASDRRCFEQSMEIMDGAFRSTRISLATHQVWQIVVGPEGHPSGMRGSWPEERALLNELRSRYGAKLVVQNNGLGGNEGCRGGEPLATAGSMWCWLATLPPPKGFQTEGNRKLRARGFAVDDAVRRAIDMGGCFVEHNEFGNDPAVAADLDRQLKANCPGAS
jgi:hypothetical protein